VSSRHRGNGVHVRRVDFALFECSCDDREVPEMPAAAHHPPRHRLRQSTRPGEPGPERYAPRRAPIRPKRRRRRLRSTPRTPTESAGTPRP
jgi:hypothetical protein